mmetsp:Transcript_22865/g.71943  ORF Transcript_22865/g.71943 Transcript_22865/m.71943 type:complete len:215 (+) Transcript_22865:819-1463(+)
MITASGSPWPPRRCRTRLAASGQAASGQAPPPSGPGRTQTASPAALVPPWRRRQCCCPLATRTSCLACHRCQISSVPALGRSRAPTRRRSATRRPPTTLPRASEPRRRSSSLACSPRASALLRSPRIQWRTWRRSTSRPRLPRVLLQPQGRVRTPDELWRSASRSSTTSLCRTSLTTPTCVLSWMKRGGSSWRTLCNSGSSKRAPVTSSRPRRP